MEAFLFLLQIYSSENRRNNIIYQGEKKKERFMLERCGEMLAKGQEWKREESSEAG